jgi:hypothetical protein
LHKIIGGVIPHSAQEQGMPAQPQHEQIASAVLVYRVEPQ